MEFFKCSVAGRAYGCGVSEVEKAMGEQVDSDFSLLNMVVFLGYLHSRVDHVKVEKSVLGLFTCICLHGSFKLLLSDLAIPMSLPLVIFCFHCNIYKMLAEGLTPSRKVVSFAETLSTSTSLPQDIHGAPPESLVSKLSEIMGSIKTVQEMALFWCKFVSALRGLWLEDQYVPGISADELPNLNCCLLYLQLQFKNCCLSRKRRREITVASLESLLREVGYDPDEPVAPRHKDKCISSSSALYAETSPGEFVLRLGADHPADNLTMLETGEPIYAPLTQEGPLLTEFVLRTGSVGAGCSQLLSDMQAFKAANPGCVLEDFVRWHSPRREGDSTSNEGFGVGHMQDTKTKGIWIWGTPIEMKINGEKMSVLFLDNEGFESIGKSNFYDDR